VLARRCWKVVGSRRCGDGRGEEAAVAAAALAAVEARIAADRKKLMNRGRDCKYVGSGSR
jgi:hypothetical protein